MRDYRHRVWTTAMLRREFREFHSTRGFAPMIEQPLVSQSFPDTFAPSAFHLEVARGVASGPVDGASSQLVGADWVFRHVDLGRITGRGVHLSAFEMLIEFCVYAADADRRQVVPQTVGVFCDFLSSVGVEIASLVVCVFGGGSFLGHDWPIDRLAIDAWTANGISPDNIIPVRGSSLFTNVVRADEPAGSRCEVYWRPDTRGMIELGTVVFEEYLLNPGGDGVVPSMGKVAGAAIGLERLSMLKNHLRCIFEMHEVASLREIVESCVGSAVSRVHKDDVCQLVDAIRSLTVIAAKNGVEHSGRRKYRFNKIVGNARRSMVSLGVGSCGRLVRDVAGKFLDSYGETYSCAEPAALPDKIATLFG